MQVFRVNPNHKGVLTAIFIVTLLLLSYTLVYSPASTIEAQPFQLRKSINLSNNTGNSYFPQIVVSGAQNQSDIDNIFVLWTDNTTGNGDIYFKRSVDNGTSFGNIENLSNSTGNSTDAQIAVNENNVYVVWTDNTTGNGDIYFKRSVDNGTSFGNIENLSNSTGNSTDAQIAVNENNVCVVWTDNTTGNGDIYFKRSVDNGTSFGNIENLSNDIGSSYGPQIIISGNNVYVVWTDNTTGNGDIYFKRSVDNGTSFGSTQNIGTYPGKSGAAQIAAYQGNVYVIWSDDTTGNGDIYFKASLDNGTKFGGRKVLAKNNGSSLEPQIAVSPNNIIYATWLDDTPYDRSEENKTTLNFLYRVSNDSGSTFANRSTIGKDVGDFADFTQIATMPGGPHSRMHNDAYVVWSDILKFREPGTFEVFFQIIKNNGTALSDPINLSNNDGDSIMSNIAVSNNGNVYVSWSDDSTGNRDVYFMAIY
jgi:hypothetical protein